MKVRIARNSGFCFGVKRAINIALEAADKHEKIVTLGPIIHNPQMVKKLEDRGIEHIEEISEIKKRPTIIRSHGIKKEMLEKLLANQIEIINATCPYVSNTQQYARNLNKEGYKVIILGDKYHPEVAALESYADDETLIVAAAEEIGEQNFSKVGVISQTTRNIKDLQKLVEKLIPLCKEIKIFNTICNATEIRQNSTMVLAKKSDLMIVIGGKNSSNTKMLAKISREIIRTHHIEVSVEIQENWFSGKEKIGITAGASTPDWIIVDVYNRIIEILGIGEKPAESVEDIPGYKEK